MIFTFLFPANTTEIVLWHENERIKTVDSFFNMRGWRKFKLFYFIRFHFIYKIQVSYILNPL